MITEKELMKLGFKANRGHLEMRASEKVALRVYGDEMYIDVKRFSYEYHKLDKYIKILWWKFRVYEMLKKEKDEVTLFCVHLSKIKLAELKTIISFYK